MSELRDDFEMPQWNVPGWDWAPEDHAWLSDSGLYEDGTSIFFIHGGRIRHQAHLPYGSYPIDEFCRMLRERAEGLDDAHVCWYEDVGDGTADLWVEGTRPPAEEDLVRLQKARDAQRRRDERELRSLRQRRPNWFGSNPGKTGV